MKRELAFLLSLTTLIPLAVGLIRWRTISESYRPVILLLGLGVLNELISYLFFYRSSNAVPTNIYLLCEFLMYSYQFLVWKHTLQKKNIFYILTGAMTAIWITENLVLGHISTFSPVFQVLYSLILILLAVNEINWLIVNERKSIIKHPIFLICIAIILFFSNKALIEIFYYYAPNQVTKSGIFSLETYINVSCNILYTLAILCIPRKISFIRL